MSEQDNPQPESQTTTPPAQGEVPPDATGQPSIEAAGKDERLWGMLCHLTALSGFIGIPLGNILGPLIVWLVKKEEMPFVNDQGKEALNFQITILIAALISAALICVVVGIFMLIAVGLIGLIFTIIASVKANSGQAYRYPWSIKFIK